MVALMAAVIVAVISANSVSLAWDANTEPDVAGYVVAVGTQRGGPYTATVSASGPSATVTDLQPGTTYYFVVRAVNQVGLLSAASNEVTATIPPVQTDDCAPVTGHYAVSVFPSSLMKTGTKTAGSRTRFDFQVASPNAPITMVEVLANGVTIASMPGADLRASAGMWFTMPPTGSYTMAVRAANSQGCTATKAYFQPLVVP